MWYTDCGLLGEITYYFRSFLERDKCFRQLSHCLAVYRGQAVDTPDLQAESKPNFDFAARAAVVNQNALSVVQNTGRAFTTGLNSFVSVFNFRGKQGVAPPAEPYEETAHGSEIGGEFGEEDEADDEDEDEDDF